MLRDANNYFKLSVRRQKYAGCKAFLLLESQSGKPPVVHSVHFDIYTCLEAFNHIFKSNITTIVN